MRILAVSDQVINILYSPHVATHVGDVDVLLACGDLPYSYMEHLVSSLNAKHAFYVHGNHDVSEKLANGTILTAPGGWQNIDRCVEWVEDKNLLIAGLEGCVRYRPGAPYQYKQNTMRKRALALIPHLLFNRVRYGRYLDIFIAHAPAWGIHEGEDNAHKGFKVFLDIIQRFKPKLFLHGHLHRYGLGPWHTHYQQTEIVNVHPFRIIKLEEGKVRYGKLGG